MSAFINVLSTCLSLHRSGIPRIRLAFSQLSLNSVGLAQVDRRKDGGEKAHDRRKAPAAGPSGLAASRDLPPPAQVPSLFLALQKRHSSRWRSCVAGNFWRLLNDGGCLVSPQGCGLSPLLHPEALCQPTRPSAGPQSYLSDKACGILGQTPHQFDTRSNWGPDEEHLAQRGH